MKNNHKNTRFYVLLSSYAIIGIVTLWFYPYQKASLWHSIITLIVVLLIFVCLYWFYKNEAPRYFSVEWLYKNNFQYPPKALGYILINLCFVGLTMLLMALLD